MRRIYYILILISAKTFCMNVIAQNLAVISECSFSNGYAIAQCKVSYRTFGKLNATKDNVVLISTWLLGRSEDGHLMFLCEKGFTG